MKFLKKLQKLPLETRKRIIIVIVGILGIVLFYFYLQGLNQQIQKFREQNYQQVLPPLPKFEFPTISTPSIEELIPTLPTTITIPTAI